MSEAEIIVKQRNEDEFGLIKDPVFNSIEEAGNYTKDLKAKLKRKAAGEEFPINTAMPEERMRFIEYALSLMTKANLPFVGEDKIKLHRAVLWLEAKGYTHQAIAGFLKRNGHSSVTPEMVKKVHKEAMIMCKDAISHVKNTQIPMLGGT